MWEKGLSITHRALRAAPHSTRRRLPCGSPAAPSPYTRVSHLSLCLYRPSLLLLPVSALLPLPLPSASACFFLAFAFAFFAAACCAVFAAFASAFAAFAAASFASFE